MRVKWLAGAAAIALAISPLTSGLELVKAAPLDPPPPCSDCQPNPGGAAHIPARQCWAYGRVGPGGPRGGGGQPVYPPQCHPTINPAPPAGGD